MNSALSDIPVERRRRLAATIGLFAVLFVTVGIVATTGSTPGVVRVFSAVALAIAALLGLIAWGVSHSVKVDLAEARLDRAIDEAMQAHGGSAAMCGCGHEHDPDEMHIRTGDGSVHEQSRTGDGSVHEQSRTGDGSVHEQSRTGDGAMHQNRTGRHESVETDACSHDGSGTECTHNCVSCVLRTLRPSPTQTREARLRAPQA